MNKLQIMAIVRDRGQITIPDKIRSVRTWVSPSSVVSISSAKIDEIVIRPFSSQDFDWDRIWGNIARSRSIRGRRGNLSKFIAEDRGRH